MPRYYVALTCVPGIGPMAAASVLAAFPGPQDAFEAGVALLRTSGLSEARTRAMAGFNDWDAVDRILEDAERAGQEIVTIADPRYPGALRMMDGAPPVLFVRGSLEDTTQLAATIVGTRHPTPYGEKVAERLGAALARAGICTVSGGARGIDGLAHRGALAAGGKTVVVCGAGLDVPYPPEHASLFEQVVAAGGTLLSELLPGTRPTRGTFPRRNRLLAGLGRAVVVVEAGDKSGALITARYAMEQNKTVIAVPGQIDRAQSKGTNRLIRDGAKPLLDIVDVVEEVLGEYQRRGRAEDEALQSFAPRVPPPPGDAGSVWDSLVLEPADTDELVEKTGMDAARVNAALVELELMGRVKRRPGNRYYANLEDQ
ncbi:MAG: DNA-processing protein DprA [Candidatus Lernaella stagnicola]|nr:DNA-processing protein DprA [Candidatus Lernaella stagnicola]